MDVRFTEEQQALRDALRDLLGDHSTIERVRAAGDGPSGVDASLHRRLLDLGVGELPGLVELGIVMEECGRMLAPAPLVATFGCAVALLRVAGGEALTAATRRGDAIPVAVLDREVAVSPSGVATGTLPHVPYAEVATHVLAPARLDDGGTALAVVAVADAAVEALPTMDRTRRLSRVRVDGAPAQLLGRDQLGPEDLARARRWAFVGLAHELVGVAAAALQRAVEHAKTREQFGRPIGCFQAVSHRCAEMFVALEEARSLAYYAAWAVDAGADDADLAAAQAKVAAGATAVSCVQSSIQVHGGIGFTWEHDLHLFLKRAWWGEGAFGPSDALLLEVADGVLSATPG